MEEEEAESELPLFGNKNSIIAKNKYCTATTVYGDMIKFVEALWDDKITNFKLKSEV